MDTRPYLLARIERFLETTGMTEREFGITTVKDHKLIKRLRSGAGVTLTSIERVEQFLTGPRD